MFFKEITENGRNSRDIYVKLIGSLLAGLLIPGISGLITPGKYFITGLLLSYVFFVFTAFIIWEGNVFLLNLINKKFDNIGGLYYKTLLVILFSNILFSALFSLALLSLWKYFSNENPGNSDAIFKGTVAIVIVAVFISNLYEIIFLNEERKDSAIRVQQLNVAKMQAEMDALKNQIDPHFIFNSLNTLSFLITSDHGNARLYNDTLARTYHYLLKNRDNDLVPLYEEIEFISNYFYLLKIRFEKTVDMVIEIEDPVTDQLYIPPISLQTLVENAFKHNGFNAENPLKIFILIRNGFITVRNEVHAKAYCEPGLGTGLDNLSRRYRLLTGKNILIENSKKRFSVRLPIITLAA